jgi:hypothetical protein
MCETGRGDETVYEEEIEITDAMIEAGRKELARYSQREDDPAWIVADVFTAMYKAMSKVKGE